VVDYAGGREVVGIVCEVRRETRGTPGGGEKTEHGGHGVCGGLSTGGCE
jgi:hypothetical protein